jgi:hypothetical protein
MPSTWRPVVCFCQAPLSQTYHIRLSSTAAYRLQHKLDITIGKNESGTLRKSKFYPSPLRMLSCATNIVAKFPNGKFSGNIVFSDILGRPQETQLMNWRVAAESRTFPAGHGTELWSHV